MHHIIYSTVPLAPVAGGYFFNHSFSTRTVAWIHIVETVHLAKTLSVSLTILCVNDMLVAAAATATPDSSLLPDVRSQLHPPSHFASKVSSLSRNCQLCIAPIHKQSRGFAWVLCIVTSVVGILLIIRIESGLVGSSEGLHLRQSLLGRTAQVSGMEPSCLHMTKTRRKDCETNHDGANTTN